MVGAATVLHRRGGRAAVAVTVGVAGGVPLGKSRGRTGTPRETAPFSPKRKRTRRPPTGAKTHGCPGLGY